MEKAVLKTIAYYDIFNFPLKAWEVHKWLFKKNAQLNAVEKILRKLEKKKILIKKNDHYFLSGKRNLVLIRKRKEEISANHLRKAKFIAAVFKIIPWVKLVGISGSLAMGASGKKDDIDFFIITENKRIWISRFFLIVLTTLAGVRRKRREKALSAAGKICINLILEENNLALKGSNIYLAHEVLQMHPLWQRDDVYFKFLHNNQWVFEYLPNWKTGIKIQNPKTKNQNYNSKFKIFWNKMENLARDFQLKIMDKPSGDERIESGALFFHPENKGLKIMEEYNKQLKRIQSAR